MTEATSSSSSISPRGGGGAAGSEATKRSYKDTLNLPKTTFPMRASLVQNEPASRKRWEKSRLYDRLRELAPQREPWPFHDGPPYANGSIHLGHMLNKTLKDFVVRTRTMMGHDVAYVPGWDCHGLPIEHKVMTELLEAGKLQKLATLTEDQRRMAIRRECHKYAEKFVKLQAEQMKRLLTLADYDHPYLTMAPEYEAATLEVFADMVAEGLVYRDLKPVHWSIENQTALAEAELEYYDREDVSIYVWFDAIDAAALANAFGVDPASLTQPAAFMIWTTTPWTLPANLAIAVHPRFTYALVELNGRPTIVAEELVESVSKVGGVDAGATLGVCSGMKLVGLTYQHPFAARQGSVVAAEYVTLEDGSGLVHTAPGHGQEDYQTGLANNLDIYCPVQADGTFDATAPDWLRGKLIWNANGDIVEHLRASGHLFHDHTFTHSYPHDWRGKTPVIFRATEQWFVSVERATKSHKASLRDMALAQTADDVMFVPEWGRNRMRGMLESRPDWCLSRQRAWGLPIPAFKTPDGDVVLTAELVRAVARIVRKKGSDVWFTGSPAEILAEYDAQSDPAAPRDLDVSTLTKMSDILDVWFESGSSWNAVLAGEQGGRERNLGFPAKLYLEGSDQHRGWFQSSLLCALGSTGRAPYEALLTHGFGVDKDGKKMSKSVGNTLEVEDLLKDYGADVCRWWVASLNYENDIKIDRSYFDVAGESYRKVRNTLRFLLSNLADFPAPQRDEETGRAKLDLSPSAMPDVSLDAWALGEYDKLAREVIAAYESYDFRAAHNALYDFCNDTMSAIYLAATKDRLYCDRPDSPRRRRTQRTMWALVEGLTRLLAPIMPHTADEAHRALWSVDPKDDSPSVHLETFIESFGVKPDSDWPLVMKRRDAALKLLEAARERDVVENPLDAAVRVADADGALARFAERVRLAGATAAARATSATPAGSAAASESFHTDFADLLGVSRVEFVPNEADAAVIPLHNEPRCERSWKRDGTVKQRADGAWLSDRDAEAVGVA